MYGNLITILTVMKGLPMTYNRDLQEDKEPLFDTVDTLKGCIYILSEMIKNLKFNREKMLEEAAKGFSTATDIAEYLVMKGIPFRNAHEIVGRIVGYCIENEKDLQFLTMEEFRLFYEGFNEDVYMCLMVENSISARNIPGGTSKEMVLKRVREIEKEAQGARQKAK